MRVLLIFLILSVIPRGWAAEPVPRSSTESIPNTLVKFEMISVPGGTMTVAGPGQPGARRQVTLKPFRIGKTEVTWDEYDVYAFRLDLPEAQRTVARSTGGAGADAVSRPSKPYGAPDRGFGHQGYPAISLTFHAAEQYCRWLSQKTGKKYRLPTEAEWEYACRAGADQPAAGVKLALDQHAWHWENSEDKTHPVAQKAPNAWGLYDMLGNAGEWCRGLDDKPVLRGGSYDDPAEKVHCGARALQTPEWNITDPQNPKSQWWLTDGPFAGFRIVQEE